MQTTKIIKCFDFDYDFVIANEIRTVRFCQTNSLIFNIIRLFSFERYGLLLKFHG